jgi:hypothetical protein
VAEDRRGDGDGRAVRDRAEPSALLHVELEERADAGEGLGVATGVRGFEAGSGRGLGEGDAVGVGERAGAVGVDGAGEQAGAEAGDPEPGPLLLREHGDGEAAGAGGVGGQAAGAQHVDRVERRGDAERSVERAAAGDGVQVRAGDDRAVPGAAPPRPDDAVAVGAHVESAGGGLADEPGAKVELGGGVHGARVAASGVAADGRDVLEKVGD